MGIKEEAKQMSKVIGIYFMKIIGFVLIMGGAVENIIWLILIGVVLVDLSPSFIKAIWKDVWRVRD